MKRKDLALIFALALLAYMAVASEKKVLIAEGYAVNREVIEAGRDIYDDHCHACHGMGRNGAPRIGKEEDWEIRMLKGMSPLISHVIGEHRRKRFLPPAENSDLDNEKIASAVAYLIRESGKSR